MRQKIFIFAVPYTYYLSTYLPACLLTYVYLSAVLPVYQSTYLFSSFLFPFYSQSYITIFLISELVFLPYFPSFSLVLLPSIPSPFTVFFPSFPLPLPYPNFHSISFICGSVFSLPSLTLPSPLQPLPPSSPFTSPLSSSSSSPSFLHPPTHPPVGHFVARLVVVVVVVGSPAGVAEGGRNTRLSFPGLTDSYRNIYRRVLLCHFILLHHTDK